MQIFLKTLSKMHTPLTIAGIIALFSGFGTATAQKDDTCSCEKWKCNQPTPKPTGCSCSEHNFFYPAAPYTGKYCVTETNCEDQEVCSTLVGLCNCDTRGLREKVREACPLMCDMCSTTTTTTTTTLPTPPPCTDSDECPTKNGFDCDCLDKCQHPLVGLHLQKICPVMCGLCGNTTTTTTTTTTTNTGCEDAETCPTKSGKECNCWEKCQHPLIGVDLRRECPVMCGLCGETPTTTTTTTSTIPEKCEDDVLCPTLIDNRGVPLCNCESIGSMVRAACPVMCKVCHTCEVPCMSATLASTTTMTKQTNLTGTCDDPNGIPRGHICIVDRKSTHPCLAGTAVLTCPTASTDIISSQKLKTLCQVCGGTSSGYGDLDSRQGWIETAITWGPNSFEGKINELSIGILAYSVFAVDECGEKIGNDLATVTALGIQADTQPCCNRNLYEATIRSQLPFGVTEQAYMVVPLTAIGALDVGWTTKPIADEVWVGGNKQTTTRKPTQVLASAASSAVTVENAEEVVSPESAATLSTESEASEDDYSTTTTAKPKSASSSSSSSSSSYSSLLLLLLLFAQSKKTLALAETKA